MSIGTGFGCGLLDGDVACSGVNNFGQLGNGTTTGSRSPVRVNLPAGRDATRISSGNRFACAVLDNGQAACWGLNSRGQLGNGSTASAPTPVLVHLPAGRAATRISSGGASACAVLDNGQAVCWGDNRAGQLGNGGTSGSLTPVAVSLPAGRTASDLSVGGSSACAVLDNGQAVCWGANASGQLGNGTRTGSSVPVDVTTPAGRTVTSLSVGSDAACAALDDGEAVCWGNGGEGKLGNGDVKNSTVPVGVRLPSGRSARSVSFGELSACAVLDNAQAVCWGDNDYFGQLGNGSTRGDAHSPVFVRLPSGAAAVGISVAGNSACAVLTSRQTVCWGDNRAGLFGDGTIRSSAIPTASGL